MNWVGQETDYFKISDVTGYYPKMFFFFWVSRKSGFCAGNEMDYKHAN